MKANPASFLAPVNGEEVPSTLPQDVVKRLKEQVRSLQTQLQTATNTIAASSAAHSAAPPTMSSSSDVSMIFDANPNNNSVLGRSAIGGVVDPNKMNQRLKELFKEKISTFREAVYLLTGFKVRKYGQICSLNCGTHVFFFCFFMCENKIYH